MRAARESAVLLVAVALVLVWSGIEPTDRATWLLEVSPILIGAPILVATRARFPLSDLAYRLLALHALVLMVGGHWTYARVPAGFWVQDLFDLSRNPYDRLGHVAQGFVPAIVAREILLRTSPVRRGAWLFFLVTCVCLAISAFYELVEWWVAVLAGQAADAFLGTQGDPWDTQWDMFLALCGAIAAQGLLAGPHDRSLARVGIDPARSGSR
jgi:putative membrane protein